MAWAVMATIGGLPKSALRNELPLSSLSLASLRRLKLQGGAFTENEAVDFERQPFGGLHPSRCLSAFFAAAHLSNRPLAPGWYADGLIPFVNPATGAAISGATLQAVPHNLVAGANQPFWVDVFVPRTAAAGYYTGSYTVSSSQGTVSGQISLHVWNFSLPMQPSASITREAGKGAGHSDSATPPIDPVMRVCPQSHRPLRLFCSSSVLISQTCRPHFGTAFNRLLNHLAGKLVGSKISQQRSEVS
jgi:hypothetical protein